MSVVPHRRETQAALEASASPPRRLHGLAKALILNQGVTTKALAANGQARSNAATLKGEAIRSRAMQRIAALADKTAAQTKQATSTAVAASRTGFATAARIGRDNVLPELGRTGARLRERTRPERLKQDHRDFLIWLHETVFDRGVEKLFFAPTKGGVALEGLSVLGPRQAHGHDYQASPSLVFEWALAAIDEDLSKLGFVDYGAGKGRVLLLAAQHPFTAVGGIEFAEELHDAATMNIAQFPRSRMKCRSVECVLDDAAELAPLEGPGVHYFFNPFSREVFAEVLNSLVASYNENPRRLYLILIDPVATDLVEQSGVFTRVELPAAQRLRAKLLSPYEIVVYRSFA
jgi:hypothetical protein